MTDGFDVAFSFPLTVEKEKLCEWCVKNFLSLPTPPKIFYATRTHSQVQQVVEELKNSPYRETRMTILGSRKQSCILPPERMAKVLRDNDNDTEADGGGVVIVTLGSQPQPPQQPSAPNSKDLDIDDGCKILRQNYYWNLHPKNKEEPKPTCCYYRPKSAIESVLRDKSLGNTAWDIEDLKSFGEEECVCPYYTSQALLEEARIVFCPYNYLIYPEIRRALQIDLTGSVVVFDEAHNLEDICRDAASMKINHYLLDVRRKALDDLLQNQRGKVGEVDVDKVRAAEFLSRLLQDLSSWMRQNAPKLPEKNIYLTNKQKEQTPRSSRSKQRPYSGEKIGPILEALGLSREGLISAWEQVEVLKGEGKETGSDDGDGDGENAEEEGPAPSPEKKVKKYKFKVPAAILRFASGLLRSIQFLYEDSNLEHFQLVLVHQARTGHGQGGGDLDIDELVLLIMCLSPAVAFKPIRDNVHSVIVASGTLSPLDSFELELETPFRRKLSAAHVVKEEQVLSCCLHRNGKGEAIDLRKKGQESEETQDEVGQLILQVCQVVPHGILVFLPSYSFMHALKQRWSRVSLLTTLQGVKEVFWEEQEKVLFEREMRRYKALIAEGKGCLLFAIFRGKISEGLNFRDDQARAVLTLGIPFPNTEAPEIKAKQAYNNRRRREKGNDTTAYLSGQQWYEGQTFRAMNQAFGRCVRHEKDWGALVLLDERFSRVQYYGQLSQWVRTGLKQVEKVEDLQSVLREFVAERKRADEEEEERSSG